MKANSIKPKPTPNWRFFVPLIFQSALILAVPAQAVYTLLSGRTIILQTVPVDPYDLLRGYSQTLRYDISSIDNLKGLPGWDSNVSNLEPGMQFYLILEAPNLAKSNLERPQPWKAVAVSRDRPSDLSPNQVALEGRTNYNWIDYGLETYYIPEDQRNEINDSIRKTLELSEKEPSFVVEVKVDSRGNSVPVSLWVDKRNYRF